MASTPTRLMTFEEFEQMPWPDSARYELRHGEVVALPPPKLKHTMIQENLRRLLDQAAAGAGTVYVEFPGRPGEREYRVADVAFVTHKRMDAMDPDGYFEGSPEFIAEILSPSNTAAEIADKRALAFETGCREFWVINPKRLQIDVYSAADSFVTFKSGDHITPHFGGSIAVDDAFSQKS